MGLNLYRLTRHALALPGRALLGWALLAGVLAVFAAPPLHAAEPKSDMTCGSRHELVASLDQNFDERPMFRGVTKYGNLVEIFTSSGGNWTILLEHPGGFSCVLSDGSLWEISDTAWRALQTPASFVPSTN